MCVGQNTICGSQFSLSTFCVPEIKLRSSGLQQCKLYLLNYLACSVVTLKRDEQECKGILGCVSGSRLCMTPKYCKSAIGDVTRWGSFAFEGSQVLKIGSHQAAEKGTKG